MKDPVSKRYKLLAEYSTDIISTLSAEGEFTFVSPACTALLGYTPQEVLGTNAMALIHPDDLRAVLTRHWPHIKEKGKWIFSYRIKNKSGSYVWFESSAQPILDKESNELKEIIMVSRDISERVKFEDRLKFALREANTARMAIDLHNNVSITDEEGVIIYVNDLFCKICQYSRQELIGSKHSIMRSDYHSEEFFREMWKKISGGEVWKGEICNKAKDGSIYWVDNTIIPLFNEAGKVYRYLSVRTDITEKKKQLEEIRLKSRALESTVEGVVILDAKSAGFPMTFSNVAFSRMTGYDSEELVGKSYKLLHGNNTHLRIIERLAQRMEIAMPFEDEIVHYKKDGTPFWNNLRVSPLTNEMGEVTHFVAMNRDVTEEKIVQLKLDLAVEQLEARVKERTQQLTSLNETLKKEIEDRSRVSAELQMANRDMIDSLTYAGRIQKAVLPKPESFSSLFEESFIFDQAKDIVSGDFLWFHQTSKYKVVVLADCTGHGVPGALLSMVCNELLNRIVTEWAMMEPAAVVELMERGFHQILNAKLPHNQLTDGVDLGILIIDNESQTARFCGAERSLYIANKGNVREIKSNGKPIGAIMKSNFHKFESTLIKIEPDDVFYMTSDGYYSQFGARTGKKFMKSQFLNLIQQMQIFNIERQSHFVKESFMQWKGNCDQVDDVLVVGFKALAEY